MATRLSAAGQRYTRTGGPVSTAHTWMAWVNRVVDTGNAFEVLYVLMDVGGTGHFTEIYITSDQWHIWDEFGALTNGTAATVGAWNHLAIVGNGTGAGSLKFYLNGVQDISGSNRTFTPDTIRIGDWTADGAPFNGALSNIQVFDAGLTQAEVQQQMWQYVPQRFANLQAWYPLLSTADDQVDYSGNGRTLTVAGVPTTEDGPPGVRWQRRRPTMPYAVAAAGGFFSRYYYEPVPLHV